MRGNKSVAEMSSGLFHTPLATKSLFLRDEGGADDGDKKEMKR